MDRCKRELHGRILQITSNVRSILYRESCLVHMLVKTGPALAGEGPNARPGTDPMQLHRLHRLKAGPSKCDKNYKKNFFLPYDNRVTTSSLPVEQIKEQLFTITTNINS